MTPTPIILPIQDDGSGVWTIVHPDLGPIYTIRVERESEDICFGHGAIQYSLELWSAREDTTAIEIDTLEVTI